MLISTKQNVGNKYTNLTNMINVIINNNVLHVYAYLKLEWVVNLLGHSFKGACTMLTVQH